MKRLACMAVLLALTTPLAASAADAASGSIGRQIEGFTLKDYHGRVHDLAEYTESKMVAVVFLGVECPLARLYAARLSELSEEFANDGVTILAIDSNRQDSIEELEHFARTYGATFPILKDPGNVVADQFGATRTPEVFLLDADRNIRYQGLIDDQYGITESISSGFARTDIRRRHLAAAIEELIAGEEVSQPWTAARGCLIGKMREVDENAPVTYSNQIARLFQKHCVECHREGQIAPFELVDYDEIAGWADMIEEVVREQRMPPWHADADQGVFTNDRGMTADERQLIYDWVAAGAPQGDPTDLPEPMVFPETWMMGEPDEIHYMSRKAYKVPAEGVIEYQYFLVDPQWTEDKWLEVSECMPGDRRVVHHVFVFAVPPDVEMPEFTDEPQEAMGEFSPGTGGIELIGGAAPGTPPMGGVPGMATRLEAGTRLLFQMHYTAAGTEVEDRTAIGFRFADPAQVRHNVTMNWAVNFGFSIPAHADNHPVESAHTFRRDALLLNFAPHMHVRGKAFRYDLEYPDGATETILDVPRYDFNWQVIYMLAEPKFVPAGTKMRCYARFDNSEENLANPDPTAEVYWGDQTWEEMMIGWFAQTTNVHPDMVPEGESRTERFVRAAQQKSPRVTGLVRRAAKTMHHTPEDIASFHQRLRKVLPQVDRVCVTRVADGQAEVVQVAQISVLETMLAGTGAGTTIDAAALAQFADAADLVVHDDLSEAENEVLLAMGQGLASSVHVPVTLDGAPAWVSLWSQEREAFPAEALSVVRELAPELAAK